MSALESVTAALADRYRIEREVGAGGMASVFLAEDLKHRRKVAVKVLRAELAASLGKDRFIREIEIAAQLAHPHILPLLDSGEASGLLYYVMPFVEGESLRDRLVRAGELPVADAIRILTQVVDALAHAHARGLVHRDIKPENVMMSGRHALVTDFGVAKALSEATGRHQLTSVGIALGTPAYMAPEQAVADPGVDHRVDIYAIGVVGYELLAGRPPFAGLSSAEVLAAHVMRAPETLTTIKPNVSPALGHVIMKCLEKSPTERWQTAEELLAELERLTTPTGGTTATRPLPAVRRGLSRRTMLLIGVGAATVIAIGAWLARRGDGPSLALGARTQVTLDPGLELDPALSPDGNVIAYVAGPPGATRLFVRQMGAGAAAVAVAPDVVARAPRWSPDGSRILLISDHGIEVVPYMGGATTRIVSRDSVQGADWAPDGSRVAYAVAGSQDSLLVRPMDGSAPTALATADEIASPAWSPDGRWIAYSVGNGRFHFGVRDLGNLAPASIWIVPAAGGTPIRVSDSTSLSVSPAWLPHDPSTLLYVSSLGGSRDIYSVHVGSQGRPEGAPQRLTTGLSVHSIAVPRSVDRIAYATYTETVNAWRIRIPATGAVSISAAEPLTRERQIMEFFRVSPDGRTLAFDSDRGGRQHIYRMPIAGGGAVQQLTSGEWDDFAPVWSNDGKSIAFHSSRTGDRDVYVVPAEGGTPQQLTTSPEREWMVDWSRQGEQVAFVSGASLGLLTKSGSWSTPRLIDTLTVRPGSPVRWSPDGGAIAFYSRDGLRVLRVGSPPSRVIVRAVSGAPQYLAWSADGRTVYYESTDARQRRAVWAIPSAGGSSRPLVWFDDPGKQATRFTLDVNGGWLYLTLGDRQADVSVVDFSRR